MFIARQPIFTSSLDVYGYELLFRGHDKATQFDGVSSLQATANVLITTLENGLSHIVGNKKAFINFDADFIKNFIPEILDKEKMVIEVLEDVEVDEVLIERIIELKKQGYKIALDDFVESIDNYPLVRYADIIKYDLLMTPLDQIEESVTIALNHEKLLLAEKIENEAEFIKAKKMGFHLFQGYFFSKPKIVSKLNTKSNSKIQYTRILNELKKAEPSYQLIAEIVEKDVKLAYRLMRVVSSRSGKDLIYSIKRALTYMGLNEIERWISIMMLQDIGEKKPKELITVSLIRSKFAEELASMCKELNNKKFEASMMGLFSTIDAFLDMSLEEALEDIALPESIKDSLINHKGELYPIYLLIMYYEKGSWEEVEKISNLLNINHNKITIAYLDSVKWANNLDSVIV